jgi:hypothetical protein
MSLVGILTWVIGGAVLCSDGFKHSSGRNLPVMPLITKPVLFDTPEADRILEAMQVFPADNPWNQDIST